MNRIAALVISVLLVVSLAGCGSSDTTTAQKTGGSSATDPASELGGGIATPDDLMTAFQADYSDAEWLPDVTDVTAETFLGAQVAVVHTSWAGAGADTDYETLNRKQSALNDAMSGYEIEFAPNNVVMYADGHFEPLGSSGQFGAGPMDTAFDLPAAPQTPEEVQSWLAAVYGPGGIVTLGPDETWYDSIQSFTTVDYGSGPSLVVMTSVPTRQSTDGSLVDLAVRTTGSPLLSAYSVKAADGTSSGGSSSAQTPGASGFFYTVD